MSVFTVRKIRNRGFTLLELIVVISIISALLLVVTFNIPWASAQSRDAKRQADLRNLQQAVELYKENNGRYPEGCRGPGFWSGQVGTNHACPDGTGEYIRGLAPRYISVLPTDPRLPAGNTDAGYVYTVNASGTVYKIMALNTVEADELLRAGNARAYTHPFKSCDMNVSQDVGGVIYQPDHSICHRVFNSAGATIGSIPPSQCHFNNSRFQNSYAIWGGLSFFPGGGRDGRPPYNIQDRRGFWDMAGVICR